ncbi:MAG: N-acetylmuramic acid 6-phosphate etherase [Thermoanaerobaculia bacterium]
MSNNRLETSLDIDRLPTPEIVDLIQAEDARVPAAVASERRRIARAIDEIAERMKSGGKLFYAGAGTSGRIAMLDAAEIPPTYGISADLVQVIMAGGRDAFFRAVEGAEDDEAAAIAEVTKKVDASDSVIGVAASGTTPFTVAAIRRANMNGALTVGITSTPNTPLVRECDIPIVIETGPEVIMGSSRMKSGTAQKLVLNTISTAVMVRLGHVYSNLMVDMPATNAKLRRRASKMVELAANLTPDLAAKALEASAGNVRRAIVIARLGVSDRDAEELLEKHGGRLREVLED